MIIIKRLKNHIYSLLQEGSVIEGLSLTSVFQYIAERHKPLDVRFELGLDTFTFRFDDLQTCRLDSSWERDIETHVRKDSIATPKPKGWFKELFR